MTRTAVICPGQGSQLVGMGRDVAEVSSRAARVFAEAGRILGFDLAAICFDGDARRLECTDVQQPAILVTSLAIGEALNEQGEGTEWFQTAAGLSLGEYTALCLAGSLSFEDAVKVVYRRGQLMQRAAETNPGGMVSLIGADENQARQLCERVAQGGVLVPANFNCPGQIVLSGDQVCCERAVPAAEEMGLRAVALKVAGAFHSPLMQSAANGLAETLANVKIRTPLVNVPSNVTGEYHRDPASIRTLLCQQLTQPVRWQQCIGRLLSDGVERFIEVGPNRVLTGLMRKIDRRAQAVNISTAKDLQTPQLAVPVG